MVMACFQCCYGFLLLLLLLLLLCRVSTSHDCACCGSRARGFESGEGGGERWVDAVPPLGQGRADKGRMLGEN